MAVSTREELTRRVLEGEVDLALMGRGPEIAPDGAAASGDPLVHEPFASNPHVFIAWPGHPLAAERGIAPIELRHESIVQREPGSGTRAMLNDFLAMHRIMPRERVTGERQRDGQARRDVPARHQPHFGAHAVPGTETGALVRLDVDHTPIVRTWYVVHHSERVAAARRRRVSRLPADEGARKVESAHAQGARSHAAAMTEVGSVGRVAASQLSRSAITCSRSGSL